METKILLIEDNREVVDTILFIFSYHWPEAKMVFSYMGKPGIEMVKTEKPDAVILDLGLPDMSGFDVMKEIRMMTDVPIIVLTAHTAEDSIVKAMEEEATESVTKPFKHRELLARVQAHVNRWKTNEIRSMMERKIIV